MYNRVVSSDLAKRLHDAGFPQDTEFSWWETIDRDDIPRLNWTDENRGDYALPTQSFEKKHAAPLADEILERLPVYVQFEKESLPFTFRIEKEIGGEFPDEFVVVYVRYSRTINSEEDYQERGRTTNESLADAAAKMWLYLKKEGLL